MQVGSLGDVVFETSASLVRTPQSLSRERSARFEEHKVMGAKARLEYVAPELDKVNMTVRLHAALGVDPVAECNRLAEMCTAGLSARLLVCGENLGRFILESVSETWRKDGANGKVQVLDVALSLKEYV